MTKCQRQEKEESVWTDVRIYDRVKYSKAEVGNC